MSCIVNPSIQHAFIQNSIVEAIQTDLAALGWIDYVYPLAEKGQRPNSGDSTVTFPRVYKQDCNEYIDLFPNENQEDAFCFFECRGNLLRDREQEQITYNLSVVFWGNLQNITSIYTHDYTDQLIVNSMNAIENVSLPNAALGNELEIVKDRTEVWDLYTYEFSDFKNFAYPYTTFRIDFEVTDFNPVSCYDNNVNLNSS